MKILWNPNITIDTCMDSLVKYLGIPLVIAAVLLISTGALLYYSVIADNTTIIGISCSIFVGYVFYCSLFHFAMAVRTNAGNPPLSSEPLHSEDAVLIEDGYETCRKCKSN